MEQIDGKLCAIINLRKYATKNKVFIESFRIINKRAFMVQFCGFGSLEDAIMNMFIIYEGITFSKNIDIIPFDKYNICHIEVYFGIGFGQKTVYNKGIKIFENDNADHNRSILRAAN